ncbi:MAG: hypothetical protein K6L80_12190 [Agarilytica sp.]
MKLILTATLFILSAASASAANWTCSTPNEYTCDGMSVNFIYLNLGSNRIYFGESSATHYFTIGDGSVWTDNAKSVYSLLLTAKSSKNKVNTYSSVDGTFQNVEQIILTEK